MLASQPHRISCPAIPSSVTDEDVSLSFLPLSHSFERLVSYVYLAHGVTIVFAESMDTIGRDMAIVRPTVMTGVPRVYEKFQARILERGHALPQPRRTLFHWGVKVAHARARAEGSGGSASGILALETRIADTLVFSKVRDSVGGRLWCLVSGSAAADARRRVFYGIADDHRKAWPDGNSPIVSANPIDAPRLGHRRQAGFPASRCGSRRTGKCSCAAQRDDGLLQQARRNRGVLKDGWFHTNGDIGSPRRRGLPSRKHAAGSEEGPAEALPRAA